MLKWYKTASPRLILVCQPQGTSVNTMCGDVNMVENDMKHDGYRVSRVDMRLPVGVPMGSCRGLPDVLASNSIFDKVSPSFRNVIQHPMPSVTPTPTPSLPPSTTPSVTPTEPPLPPALLLPRRLLLRRLLLRRLLPHRLL